MYYFATLFRKELLLLKNTFLRTPKQAVSLIAIILVACAAVGLLSWFAYRGMKGFFEELPLTGEVIGAIVILAYAFLGALILFSVIEESRKRFFLTPDMSLLMATPVKPSVILVVRFVMFVLTNPSILVQFAIFGLPLLISLGILVEAQWPYYVFLLPLTYLYFFVPAALGTCLVMLLMRLFSPKQLFRIASLATLLIVIVWVNLLISYQDFALRAMEWLINSPVYYVFLPLSSAGDILVGLAGFGMDNLYSIPVLLAGVPLGIGLVVVIVQRVYYLNYERLQVTEWSETKVNKAKRFSISLGSSQFAILVSHHYVMAFRNKEMAPGAVFMLVLPVVYVASIGSLVDSAEPYIMLISLAVITFFVTLAVGILYTPHNYLENRSMVRQQYWILKSAPVKETQVITSYLLASIPLTIIISVALLVLAGVFTGLSIGYIIFSVIIIMLLVISNTAILELTSLLEVRDYGETVTFLGKAVRDYGPLFYPVLALLPLAGGMYYRQVGFLSFMHNFSPELVLTAGTILTIALCSFVYFVSLKKMHRVWVKLEIK